MNRQQPQGLRLDGARGTAGGAPSAQNSPSPDRVHVLNMPGALLQNVYMCASKLHIE